MSITRFGVHAQHGHIHQEYKGAYVTYEDHEAAIKELGETGLGLAACAREWESLYNTEVLNHARTNKLKMFWFYLYTSAVATIAVLAVVVVVVVVVVR